MSQGGQSSTDWGLWSHTLSCPTGINRSSLRRHQGNATVLSDLGISCVTCEKEAWAQRLSVGRTSLFTPVLGLVLSPGLDPASLGEAETLKMGPRGASCQ